MRKENTKRSFTEEGELLVDLLDEFGESGALVSVRKSELLSYANEKEPSSGTENQVSRRFTILEKVMNDNFEFGDIEALRDPTDVSKVKKLLFQKLKTQNVENLYLCIDSLMYLGGGKVLENMRNRLKRELHAFWPFAKRRAAHSNAVFLSSAILQVNNSDELALSVILEALDSSDKNAKISAIRAISGATMNQVKTATVRNLHEEVQRVIKSEDFDLALYVAALPILIQYDKENVIRKCKQLLKGGEKITGPLIHTFHSSRGVVAAHILFLLKDWLPHENNPLSMIGIIHAIKDFISKEILLEVISHGLTHDSPYVRLSFTKTMRYLEKDEMTTLIESNIHQEPDEYLKSVMKSYL